MFEAKKIQIAEDKKTLADAKLNYQKYRNMANNAKNNGMKTINAAKANELAGLIDIIERRCKVLAK